jgi:hypothetical protein
MADDYEAKRADAQNAFTRWLDATFGPKRRANNTSKGGYDMAGNPLPGEPPPKWLPPDIDTGTMTLIETCELENLREQKSHYAREVGRLNARIADKEEWRQKYFGLDKKVDTFRDQAFGDAGDLIRQEHETAKVLAALNEVLGTFMTWRSGAIGSAITPEQYRRWRAVADACDLPEDDS